VTPAPVDLGAELLTHLGVAGLTSAAELLALAETSAHAGYRAAVYATIRRDLVEIGAWLRGPDMARYPALERRRRVIESLGWLLDAHERGDEDLARRALAEMAAA